MLATVSSVVAQVIDGYFGIDTKIQALLYVFMAIGLGGYQANIIQFGMDQLHDASTTEITAFIIWYVWTLLSAGIIVDFISACLSQKNMLIRPLFVSTTLTLALVLLLCCKHWLVIELVKHNSYKLIYEITKYVIVPKTEKCFHIL